MPDFCSSGGWTRNQRLAFTSAGTEHQSGTPSGATVFSDYNARAVEEYRYGGDTYQGRKIRDYSRKEVKNESKKTTNFPVINDWAYRVPDKTYASYVVFEYDGQ